MRNRRWADLWGKQLDQRRLAKELKRYGVKSQDVRKGNMNRKGYVVAGDTGLAQAWRRYLSPVGKRDNRDKRDSAGQGDSGPRHERDKRDTPRQERDKRDTNATTETPSEQRVSESVADVADTDGMRRNGSTVSNVFCRYCATRIPEHMRAARLRGVCTDCTAKATSKR